MHCDRKRNIGYQKDIPQHINWNKVKCKKYAFTPRRGIGKWNVTRQSEHMQGQWFSKTQCEHSIGNHHNIYSVEKFQFN